jgi:hypothetical protein
VDDPRRSSTSWMVMTSMFEKIVVVKGRNLQALLQLLGTMQKKSLHSDLVRTPSSQDPFLLWMRPRLCVLQLRCVEQLSSLFRKISAPRELNCYLKEGLKVAQWQCLPLRAANLLSTWLKHMCSVMTMLQPLSRWTVSCTCSAAWRGEGEDRNNEQVGGE